VVDGVGDGDLAAVVVHPLRLVVQGEPIAVPGRDRGVQLDRVVLLARVRVRRGAAA